VTPAPRARDRRRLAHWLGRRRPTSSASRRRQTLGRPPPHAQPCALPLPTRPACHCRSIPHTQTRRLLELLAALAVPTAPYLHCRNPPSRLLAIPPHRCCGVDPQPRCRCSPTAPRDATPSLRHRPLAPSRCHRRASTSIQTPRRHSSLPS